MTAPTNPICARCGEPVTPGARFCMKCGSDVSGEQGSVATAMLPAAQERDANDAVLEMLRQGTIGEYEILRELGRGGMATVYLAHDIALDRKVAIKAMSPALLLMGEGMTERFKREARTAANLSHPHIIPIYTVKGSGKSLFFVMKFISGRSLEAIVKDLGPMPVPMIKAILHQVGSALGYAHRNGIVHRDVKPANIMIDEEGWSVVTDFGIAKVAENRALTMTGIAVGTPSYMSPEQCAAKDITGKSDQYSLGVVAYEMLTGRQPFEGDSAMAIMFAHFNEQPKPVTGARPDCPADLANAVMRMLEKSPDKRFPTMEEGIAALGGQALAHDDPIRHKLIEIAKRGSSGDILKKLTPPPTSPVPPARTRQVEHATTPIPAPKVLSVAVVPARSDLHVGDTMQLTATPRVAGGTAAGGRVTWSSSDAAVASVGATGLVTATAAGTAVISAACEGVGGSAKVTVTPVPVGTVIVEPIEATLAVGEELSFKVALRDPHGAPLRDRPVTWSALPKGAISLGGTGQVKALREGVVEVLAECEGVKGSARLTVTPAPVASVAITPAEFTLTPGESATLRAALADRHGGSLADRELSWRSSSGSVATVSDRGVVTAVAEGAAEITVVSEGKQATARLLVSPAAVASIVVSEPKPLVAGERIQLQAAARDARGQVLAGRAVKWSSSSPAIATVTSDGYLTGMGAGTARITAEVEGKTTTVSVTVTPVPVATVTIEGPTEPVTPGASFTLRSVVKDARGNLLKGREVAWSTNAARIATVGKDGAVTAKSTGDSVIAVTVEGKKAEFRLTVLAPAPAPEAKTQIIEPSARVEAPVRPQPAAPPVTEPPRRSTPKLVGALVGVAVLAAVAFALLRPGEPAPPPSPPPPPQAPVSVASVTVSGEAGPVAVGRSQQLAAVTRDSAGAELAGRPVTWSSSDSAVVGVSSLGAVTGRKPGSATITAESEGRSGTHVVTVEAPTSDLPAAVASVVVTGGGTPLEIGGTLQLTAQARDAKGSVLADRTVVWSTADPRVALVGSNGLVTAVGAGSVTISASSEGRSGEAGVTVTPPKPPPPAAVAGVAVTPAAVTLTVGGTAQLSAAVLDDKRRPLPDRTVAWKSADERIARVGTDGLVTAVGKGTATITAVAEGKSSTARVTVNEAVIPVIPVGSVALIALVRELRVGETITWTAVARDGKGKDLADRPIRWTSSAPQVATVSGTGFVTAVAAGSADIRVEAEGKSATARVTVKEAVIPVIPVGSVALTAKDRELKVGETTTWTAVARDGKGKELADRPIIWSSAAPQIATVTSSGLITAMAAGSAEIRAEAEGKDDRERVVVFAAPTPPPLPPISGPGPGPGNPPAPNALLPRRGVEAGGAFSCGIAQNGAVCWGGAQDGLLAIEGTSGITHLTMGRAHACGLLPGGRAICWGDNKLGQLGDGSINLSASAASVSGDLSFSVLTAGAQHTCGIAGGKAFCWGRGKEGQLGDGGTADRKRPVAVKGAPALTTISAGTGHTCGITAAGKAYCWGDGFSGQLGFGGQDQMVEPVDVSGGQKFERIAAGGKHTCALTAAGKAFCWGANESGQVGDGSKSDRGTPAAVSGGQTFTEISAGGAHSCGLTAGGEIFCWGENKSGQLGDGGRVDRAKPVQVSGQGFASVSTGEGHTCGMTRSGEAMCWGRNERGQLGDGSITPRALPGPVRAP